MPKKSYNPFKLFGSYVGLVFGGLGYILVKPSWRLFQGNGFSSYLSGVAQVFTSTQGDFYIPTYLGIPFYAIIGFLIGYGIHALIRALRN